MAKNRGSDNVVMPDITEVSEADPLAVAAEHDTERSEDDSVLPDSSIKSGRLTSETNGVVTVPVSLPVGTLITGTTFNVITSDQLPHFKPMICVDNGFISGGPVNDDVKATHIVIQNPPSPTARPEHESAVAVPVVRAATARSWAETASMPVLPVRCKNTSAELHKHKFGSGGRGRCIKYALEWYTPSEFEALCGRASSKDWKRSIRFGGRSIQALIDEGILTPHATSCTCGACCDDQSAMGPVRLFTPYKRKRRNAEGEDKKLRIKHDTSLGDSDVDNIHQNSNNSHSKEAWQSITEGLENNTEYHLLENPETTQDPSTAYIHSTVGRRQPIALQGSSEHSPPRWSSTNSSRSGSWIPTSRASGFPCTVRPPATSLPIARTEPSPSTSSDTDGVRLEVYQTVTPAVPDLNGVVKRLDEISSTLVRLSSELKQCVEDIRFVSQRQMERFDHERTSAIIAAGVDAQVDSEPVSLHNVEDTESKKCANCNREASAECSLCRRTPYCSTYCQKKDWASHQLECLRSVPTIHTDSQQHQSIMLIVESPHQ